MKVFWFGHWSSLLSVSFRKTQISFILWVRDPRTPDPVVPLGRGNTAVTEPAGVVIVTVPVVTEGQTASALADGVLSPAGRRCRRNGPEDAPSLQLSLSPKERGTKGALQHRGGVVARRVLLRTRWISKMFPDLELCVYLWLMQQFPPRCILRALGWLALNPFNFHPVYFRSFIISLGGMRPWKFQLSKSHTLFPGLQLS